MDVKLEHFGEPGYTLDRENNDGNYEPCNVRWATHAQQNRTKLYLHGIFAATGANVYSDLLKQSLKISWVVRQFESNLLRGRRTCKSNIESNSACQ